MYLPITISDFCGPYGVESVEISIQTLGLIGFFILQLSTKKRVYVTYFLFDHSTTITQNDILNELIYHVDFSYQ